VNPFQYLTRRYESDPGFLTTTTTPTTFNVTQGLKLDADTGAVYITTSEPIAYHNQGIPFAADGAVCVSEEPDVRVDQGIPYTADNRIAVVNLGMPTHVSSGLEYNTTSSLVIHTDVPPDEPGQVQNFVSVPGAVDNQIDSTWDAVVVVPAVTHYIYEYKEATSGTWISANIGLVTNYTIVGPLLSGVLYNTRVAAVNINGQGPWSVISNVTVEGVPEQVQNLATTALPDSVECTWDTPTAAPPVNGYELEYKENSSGTWNAISLGAVNSHIVSGLNGGTLYDFRVRAVNSKGNGAWSAIVMETPIALPLAEIVWDNTGIDTVAPNVNFWNNTGTDPNYDLDQVVGNVGNSSPNTHKGLNMVSIIGTYGLDPSVLGPPVLGTQYSFAVALKPNFLDGNNRYVWFGQGASQNLVLGNNGSLLFSGASLNFPALSTATEWIIFGVVEGATSRVRIVSNQGTDTTTNGNAGAQDVRPEGVAWQGEQTANLDYVGDMYEFRFWSGLLNSAEEDAVIEDLKQKWFVGVTQTNQVAYSDFDPADFDNTDYETE
jgi:hypothetical protein